MFDTVAVMADGVDVQEGIPLEIKILPLGRVTSKKGTFLVDDESCRMILKEFEKRKIDLVVDYEHQTMLNMQAPAGGWIRELRQGEDAIIAKVEWTEKAKEYLKNREYRYLSPVIKVRKDGRVESIHSVALTNTPAIDGMFAICSDRLEDFLKEGDKTMDLKEIAAIFGLPENATEEDVKKAAKAAAAQAEEMKAAKNAESGDKTVANSTILGLLELPPDARTEDVTSKIMQLKNGSDSTSQRLKALEDEMKENAADAAVMQALKDGKISAAQKEWAKSYALKDPEGFRKFAEQAPVIVFQGRMKLKDSPGSGAEGEEFSTVLKDMGLSEDDYVKYYKKEE